MRALAYQSSQNDRIINEKQQEYVFCFRCQNDPLNFCYSISRLREQQDHMNRKISSLRNWDRDCAEVIEWLLRNKESNEFAKRVDLPAVVGVTVRDRQFADAVESCFTANQLKVSHDALYHDLYLYQLM